MAGRLAVGSRRTTELFLLIAGAVPVLLIYSMYVANTGAELTFETLAVPIGLIAAFIAAHIAVRIFAPGADPRIPLCRAMLLSAPSAARKSLLSRLMLWHAAYSMRIANAW